jgi:predicted acyltransferase
MEAKRRLVFLDQFRGMAILLMVFANSLEHYQHVPAYLKHARSGGFNLPDIVAPMFLFAIGFGGEWSFPSRRTKNGTPKTVLHLIGRNLLLFVFGFSGTLMVSGHSWDILQTLGTVGLLAIPFFFLQPAVRFIVALASAVAHQMIVTGCFGNGVADVFAHHGVAEPFAAFSLILILTSGSCLSAWLKEKPYAARIVWLLAAGATLLAAEIVFCCFVPFQKRSLSFVLLSTGICAWGFLFFTVISEQFHVSVQPLEAMGKNALVMYMLSSVLIQFFEHVVPYSVPFPAALAGFVAVMLLTYLAGTILAWKEIYIKL